MAGPRLRRIVITGAAALALAAGGTAAGAAIAAGPVDSSGVIHGCWTNAAINGTHAFVLQDAGTNCPKGSTAISWNQQGPAGAPGTGATVASLASGNANCAPGGASITDGKGDVAYACNGAAGATGPQGPAGSSGVEIDAGTALAQDGSGNYYCEGGSVGPDAGSIKISPYATNYGDTECVISGFPSPAVLVSINSANSDSLPAGWFSYSDSSAPDCPGSGYCIIVNLPDSALQANLVTFYWEVMQTAPSTAMSSTAVKRVQQAARRIAAEELRLRRR